MGVIPFRPRHAQQAAMATPPPYGQFAALRNHMLKTWQDWLETNPPADLAAQEIEATASAMRQMNELMTKASA